jgi:hypothetical protein
MRSGSDFFGGPHGGIRRTVWGEKSMSLSIHIETTQKLMSVIEEKYARIHALETALVEIEHTNTLGNARRIAQAALGVSAKKRSASALEASPR